MQRQQPECERVRHGSRGRTAGSGCSECERHETLQSDDDGADPDTERQQFGKNKGATRDRFRQDPRRGAGLLLADNRSLGQNGDSYRTE